MNIGKKEGRTKKNSISPSNIFIFGGEHTHRRSNLLIGKMLPDNPEKREGNKKKQQNFIFSLSAPLFGEERNQTRGKTHKNIVFVEKEVNNNMYEITKFFFFFCRENFVRFLFMWKFWVKTQEHEFVHRLLIPLKKKFDAFQRNSQTQM